MTLGVSGSVKDSHRTRNGQADAGSSLLARVVFLAQADEGDAGFAAR